MPEVGQLGYSIKELTTLMLRDQEIRRGLWMIWVKFAQGVANIAPPSDEGGLVGPGALAVVVEVGIQKAPAPGPLTVDASQIWTKPRRASKRAAKAK